MPTIGIGQEQNSYESLNQLLRVVIPNLRKAKSRMIANLWVDLLEKQRTKNFFPDDVQLNAQCYLLNFLITNTLAGPFKKHPQQFSDPLFYVVKNYTLREVHDIVRNHSILKLRNEHPNLRDEDCVGVLRNIQNFGLHYKKITKARFEEELKQNNLGIGAFQVLVVNECSNRQSQAM